MKVVLVSITFATPYTPQCHFLSLGYIHAAAACDPVVGPATDIVHEFYDPSVLSIDEIADKIAELSPDVVGFTCYVWNRVDVFNISDKLKTLTPNCRIITGGPEVSYHHIRILDQQPAIDYVAVGEGEHTFREFMHCLVEDRHDDLQQVPGLAQRINGKPTLPAPRPYEKNLDVFPSPYLSGVMKVCDIRRGTNYQTARGCPFVCTFCDYGRNQPYFEFSMERVRAEMEFFKKHNSRLIVNVDPTFNYSRQRAEGILQMFIDLDIEGFHWCEVFPTLINDDLVDLMKEANLSFVGCGIQTCTPTTMRNIRRVWRPEKVEPILDQLKHRPNIMMSYEIIMGLPGDTIQNYKDTVSWTYAREPADIKSFNLAVLPRTPLEKEVEKWEIEYDPDVAHEIRSTGAMSRHDVMVGRTINDWHRLIQNMFFRLCRIVKEPAGEMIERWGWAAHEAGFHHRIPEMQVHRIPSDLIEGLAEPWEKFVAQLCKESDVADVSAQFRDLFRYMLYRRGRTWVSTFFGDMRDIMFNEPYPHLHRIYSATTDQLIEADDVDLSEVPKLGGNVDRHFFNYDMVEVFPATAVADIAAIERKETEYLFYMTPDSGVGCGIAIDDAARQFVEKVDGKKTAEQIISEMNGFSDVGARVYATLKQTGIFEQPTFLNEYEDGVVTWQSAYPETFREYH